MALEIDIRKTLPDFKLDIRFHADKETLGILGASGSGKSMTLKCIAGIETPDEGVIILDGFPLFDSEKKHNIPPQKRKTGYLFQNAALFPNMTVGQNLVCAQQMRKKRREKREMACRALRRVGLDGYENRYPDALSGGQQQRAALVRLLLSEPRLLLLDEPFSALDSSLRWQLEREIGQTLETFGGTALFVSHNRDEVYRLCDRLLVISDGNVQTEGEKWHLFNDPGTLAACQLTGCKNVSPVRILSENRIFAEDWGLTLSVDINKIKACGTPQFVGIRAHHIHLTADETLANTFAYDLAGSLQDTFSDILLLRKKGDVSAEALRFDVPREDAKAPSTLPRYMRLPPENLLLLRR
ncbi:ATP-binding cassette domain-containing protein [Oscillospiraceae bacterium CM]|nr:ATP-binding cassette domain-containing protein [Oscillospiraceae bacterium CM]